MPISKANIKWHSFVASEIGLPEDSIWIDDNTSARTNVFVWTEKLTRQQFRRLISAKSAGGPSSLRGRLQRLLDELNADGWMTKVKPSEATTDDIYPISHLGAKKFCRCGAEMLTPKEQVRKVCGVCKPIPKNL